MAGKAKKKIFFPKTRLSELAARAGGMLRDDALDGAMASLETMRAQSDGEIRKSIAAMEGIVFARETADGLARLAATSCSAALDSAARSLGDIPDGLMRAVMHNRKPVAVHVQTLHL